MRLENEPAGIEHTAGFVQHRGWTGTGCTRTRNGYSYCGFGYGLRKADPRVTCAEPYWEDRKLGKVKLHGLIVLNFLHSPVLLIIGLRSSPESQKGHNTWYRTLPSEAYLTCRLVNQYFLVLFSLHLSLCSVSFSTLQVSFSLCHLLMAYIYLWEEFQRRIDLRATQVTPSEFGGFKFLCLAPIFPWKNRKPRLRIHSFHGLMQRAAR